MQDGRTSQVLKYAWPPRVSCYARPGTDTTSEHLLVQFLTKGGPRDLKNQQKTHFIDLAHHPGHLRCRQQIFGWPRAIFASATPALWACDLRAFPTLGALYLSGTRTDGRQGSVKAENDQFEFRDCAQKPAGNSPRK